MREDTRPTTGPGILIVIAVSEHYFVRNKAELTGSA